MKKFKLWLKKYAFFIIYQTIIWTLYILALTLPIPEWASIVMASVGAIILLTVPGFILWDRNVKMKKKEDEKEVEDGNID